MVSSSRFKRDIRSKAGDIAVQTNQLAPFWIEEGQGCTAKAVSMNSVSRPAKILDSRRRCVFRMRLVRLGPVVKIFKGRMQAIRLTADRTTDDSRSEFG